MPRVAFLSSWKTFCLREYALVRLCDSALCDDLSFLSGSFLSFGVCSVAAVLQARACVKGPTGVQNSLDVVCTVQPVRQGRRAGRAGLALQQVGVKFAAYAPTLIWALICMLCRTFAAIQGVGVRAHKLRSALCINVHGVVCSGGDSVVAQAWI